MRLPPAQAKLDNNISHDDHTQWNMSGASEAFPSMSSNPTLTSKDGALLPLFLLVNRV